MTQTRDKLARERIKDQRIAIKTHENVGKEVRDAISRIGGTPPEQLSPAEHIKLVEKRVKHASPKLELEEKDAQGLIGHSEEE
jgi:DNA-damage-inducible protein D